MAFNAGAVIIRVLPDMKSFEAGIHASTRTLGQRIGALGSSLTRSVTLPLVAAGAAAVKLAVDFETSMGKIQGLVGVSAKQTKEWSKQLLELAREGPIGPRELAEALYFVASSGIAVEDSMSIVRESARAAAAGLGDTVEIADLLTSAINVYGIESLNAAEASDILVAAVREGKGEADEYAEALGRVLPVSNTLGVSFDQTAAAASALTLGGLDIYEAVTALRQVFNAFIKPSVAGKEALNELGTSIGEIRRKLRDEGTIETVEFLAEKLQLLGDPKFADLDRLGKIFPNIRGNVGFLNLVANLEHNKELFADLADSAGDADKAFNVVAETTEFKMKRALASLESTAIQFGNLLLPLVQNVATFFGEIADLFGSFSEDTRETILIFAGVAAAIGPVLMLLGRFMSPIGLIVLGLSAIATVVIKNWKHIVPVIQMVRDWIVSTWQSASRAFGPFIKALMEVVPSFEQIKAWAIIAWNAIVSGAKMIASFVMRFVVKPLVAAFNFLKPIAIAVYDWFVEYVVGAIIMVWDAAMRFWDFIKGDLLSVLEAIGAVIMENVWPALQNLWDAFKSLWSIIAPLATFIFNVFIDVWQTLWPVIKIVLGVIIAVVGWLIRLAARILGPVIRAIGQLIEWISQVIEWIAGFIGWLGSIIGVMVRVGKAIGRGFIRAWEVVKGAWGAAVGFFKRIWWAIESGLVAAANAIAGAFEWMINAVITGLNFLIDQFNKIPLFPNIGNIDKVNFSAFRVSFDNFVNQGGGGDAADSGRGRANGPRPNVELAAGGIVTRPTVALLGEGGPEAVIPLSRMRHGNEVMELRITNWETGQGYVRRLARSEVDDDNEYKNRLNRFGRAK